MFIDDAGIPTDADPDDKPVEPRRHFHLAILPDKVVSKFEIPVAAYSGWNWEQRKRGGMEIRT